MDKLKMIIAGYKNLLIVEDERVEKMAEERAKFCAECPLAQWSLVATLLLKDNVLNEIAGMVCKECGCPLSAKVRSPSSECPLEEPYKKWKPINLNNDGSIEDQTLSRSVGERFVPIDTNDNDDK